MNPSNLPDGFWNHLPAWIWPAIILPGIIAFFAYEVIKGSEKFASLFGRIGRRIHERATAQKKTLLTVERIEHALEQATDNLECATAYLVTVDAPWHLEANVIIAEEAPHVFSLLPPRIPFIDFKRKWREGFRPPAYLETA